MVLKAFGHAAVKIGEFAALLHQHFFDVARAEAADFADADRGIERNAGVLRANAVDQARPQGAELNRLAARHLFARERAHDAFVAAFYGCREVGRQDRFGLFVEDGRRHGHVRMMGQNDTAF